MSAETITCMQSVNLSVFRANMVDDVIHYLVTCRESSFHTYKEAKINRQLNTLLDFYEWQMMSWSGRRCSDFTGHWSQTIPFPPLQRKYCEIIRFSRRWTFHSVKMNKYFTFLLKKIFFHVLKIRLSQCFFFLLSWLIITSLAKSVHNKLQIFFLFFTGDKVWHFIQMVSTGDNFDKMSSLIFL